MRILLWSDLFVPYIGGAERLNDGLVSELTARGHEFSIITSHHYLPLPDTDDHDGTPVHRLPFRPALAARDLPAITAAFARARAVESAFRPDVVHMTLVGPSSLFHSSARGVSGGPPLVLTMQQVIDPQQDDDSVMARAVRAADWVAACSMDELHTLRRHWPEVTPRSSAIVNALAPPPDRPSPLPFSPPRLVGLGRGIRRKGFDLAVEALDRLRDRFPDLTLELVTDGPAMADVERRVGELGLAERVTFRGLVPPEDVFAALDRGTIVVLPSRTAEPFGLVALEAAFMGRPVVASRLGGLPEIVADGVTGFVVPPDDVDALAGAIARLLAEPGLARAMGAAARRRAHDHFTFQRYVDDYEALYHQVAAQRQPVG